MNYYYSLILFLIVLTGAVVSTFYAVKENEKKPEDFNKFGFQFLVFLSVVLWLSIFYVIFRYYEYYTSQKVKAMMFGKSLNYCDNLKNICKEKLPVNVYEKYCQVQKPQQVQKPTVNPLSLSELKKCDNNPNCDITINPKCCTPIQKQYIRSECLSNPNFGDKYCIGVGPF